MGQEKGNTAPLVHTEWGPWSKVFPEPHLRYEDLLTCHDREAGSQPGSR